MSFSSESHGFPLQPYNSIEKSNKGGRHVKPRPTHSSLSTQASSSLLGFYDDTEFRLLRVISKNSIPIIPSSDIELHTSDLLGDSSSRSGFSMQVYKGALKPTGQAVALKRFKTYFDDKDDEALTKYYRTINDFSFELQILSKSSLQKHRNIVTLLGITFDDSTSVSGELQFSIPMSVVELAHPQYPDLSLYFDRNINPNLSDNIPFETSASFIADIADGIAALHKHDVIHADLKPENILLFPDEGSPNGLVAKISDFGFSGMTTYTGKGVRGPLPDNVPRGGTWDWNAPECLGEDNHANVPFYEQPVNHPGRDIYSFGLVVCFVAMNGRYPRNFTENLREAKLNDTMIDITKSSLSTYYESYSDTSFLKKFLYIIENTLNLHPEKRMKTLDNMREFLFDGQSHYEHPEAKVFVLDFNLVPSSVHELKCSGLYNAYWATPVAFRRRAYGWLMGITMGFFPLYVDRKIFEELKEREQENPT